MNEHNSASPPPSLPRYFQYIKPVFEVQKELGGASKAAEVRDRVVDKGILMMTNTFTMDAKWEAAREGVLPIMLVDRYKLLELINQL